MLVTYSIACSPVTHGVFVTSNKVWRKSHFYCSVVTVSPLKSFIVLTDYIVQSVTCHVGVRRVDVCDKSADF